MNRSGSSATASRWNRRTCCEERRVTGWPGRVPACKPANRLNDKAWNFIPVRIVTKKGGCMVTFLLWCLLLVVCWPLALLALVLYPLVWLILLPFRIVGIAVGGVLELIWALVTLPARILKAIA